MTATVLVVDDEPLARERIVDLLSGRDDVRVVGTCADGASALVAVRSHRPDILFLDVRMPGLDGLATLEALGDDRPAAVIFVTAFDRYAVRAFEVAAVDYLLKPFDRERFDRALQRARDALVHPRGGGWARVEALVRELGGRSSPRPGGRLAVKTGAGTRFVPFDDVEWIESAGNYAVVHTTGGDHLDRVTMADLEARLPVDRFVRVHRTAIVRVDAVVEVRGASGSSPLRVVLASGEEVPLSRRHVDELEARLTER